MTQSPGYTAFADMRCLARGPLIDVALAVREWLAEGHDLPLIFSDATGRVVDVSQQGTESDVRERVLAMEAPAPSGGPEARRGRGRPRLGVVSKEVTLLPRHWAWLATQRGGASAALRRLVDQARKVGEPEERVRRSQDAAYRFMSAVAGDLPGYEEALRALFRGDAAHFDAAAAAWPADVRDYARSLAASALNPPRQD